LPPGRCGAKVEAAHTAPTQTRLALHNTVQPLLQQRLRQRLETLLLQLLLLLMWLLLLLLL
jgi:hypothetical protein